MTSQSVFSAIVLAGDRNPNDPLVQAADVCCKALVPINSTPMVLRALKALRESQYVKQRLLCGPPWNALQDQPLLLELIEANDIQWLENQPTPSLSAYHAMQTLPAATPILITTADHALLTPKIVDYFCQQALASECDVLVTLARHELVSSAYPGVKRTALKFSDDSYSGCNLFAFLTPEGRRIADFWRQVEKQRKNPLRVVRAAGWLAVLRYLLGQLSLDQALASMSQRLNLRIGAVIIPYAEAAVDVDTVEDWALVKKIAQKST